MRKKLSKILIAGGAGFMGSAFTKLAAKQDYPVIVLDKLTYAGDLARLREIIGRYKFYKADISHKKQIESIFKKERPRFLVNFAAQTHVDRSIRDSAPFIKTNVMGTRVLLDAAKKYKVNTFIHLSSDEVYGEISKGQFNEDSPLKPNSPYAASKAAADLLIRSYIRTYGSAVIIVRPCNNYGPWQYPEKFIPLAILRTLKGKKIPIYGKGGNVREWLYVTDCAEGILKILEKGRTGEIYNLGSNQEKKNIDIAKIILGMLNKNEDLIDFIRDRPGHDIRYSLNFRKVFREIGWQPKINLNDGLIRLVNWCLRHRDWLFTKCGNLRSPYKKDRSG